MAVKHLKSSLLQSDRDLNDFFHEAALLNKLSHPAVVNFVGVAVETGSPEKGDKQLLQTQKSIGRRSVEILRSRLTMKKAQAAIGHDFSGELADTPSLGDKHQLSFPLKRVMLVQEYMTRGTMKSLLLKQMQHPLKLVYTRQEALEWLMQIAQGLESVP